MKLEFYPEKKLKKEILKIVGKHLDLSKYRVFFFGSRVKGDNFPQADIDIGIEGPRPVSLEIMAKIKEEISGLPILYHTDVIDFRQAEEDFRKVAKQNIEMITK